MFKTHQQGIYVNRHMPTRKWRRTGVNYFIMETRSPQDSNHDPDASAREVSRLQKLNNALEDSIAQRTQSLRLSQSELRDLIESVNDAIFTTDPAGRILFANQATFEMLGYTPSELIGQRFTQFIPSGFKAFGDRIKEAAKRRDVQLYAEVQVVHADGSARWIGQNVRFKYFEGKLLKVQVVGRDITAQREFDRKLRGSEEKYRGIIENMELGLLEVDMHGIVVRAYDHFCEMLGYSEEELIGRDPADFLLAASEQREMGDRIDERAGGQAGLYEANVLTKSGEEKCLLISAAPVLGTNGEVVGSVGIHYDITARKKNEDALDQARREALAARDAEKDFLAKMSHEIRTPMNAVVGMAHLLKDTGLNTEQREYTGAILHAANLLQGLLNSVLDLSKIDGGAIQCKYRSGSFQNTLLEVYDSFRFILREKGVELSLDVDPALPGLLKFDRGIVSQILLNLVGNAVKFTDSGKIVISARWFPALRGESPHVMLGVSDTGVGISAGEVSLIFERFHQVEQAGEFRSGSTGLGLSIVRELAEIHGGHVSVKSEEGEGSLFEVDLVVHEPKMQPVSQRAAPSTFKGIRVLIAEDNPFNARYITRLMQRWGVQYKLVENGLLAVENYANSTWDLVLMDVQMPECDGLEATRKIRAIEADRGTRTAGIIGLSAFDFDHDIQAAMQAGMDHHIRKPYTPDDLSNKMRMALEAEGEPLRPDLVRSPEHPVHTMCEGDEELWAELQDVFRNGWPQLRKEIESSVAENSAKMLHQALHKIKPSLAMVDLQDAYGRCVSMERRAKTGENLPRDEVARLVDEIALWAK
jgi:PAS domain S-box-containing protein